MKKQIITLVALAGIVAGATLAYGAAGSQGGGIVGSKHDMNVFLTNNGGVKDTDQRVCAYCHTPHHSADPTQTSTVTVTDPGTGTTTDITYNVYVPLWSRAVLSTQFDQYVSATFNPAADGKFYDNMAGPSRLCMSCHDGNTAVDSYYGKTGTVSNLGDDQMNYFGSGHFAIGQSYGLSNDHPVGFVYADMQGDSRYELKTADSSIGVKKISDVLTNIDGVGAVMTCASCHDVHNGTAVQNTAPASGRGYFLLADQKDSALCLSCHDKNK
ncbi:cytochrome c3 family protein [Geobacter sp. AOG2]|uniref:cytochrome c3 family protein n=1 Tax=Geobacter sp. AOG2 TaxID=1566347 RepID=UPI001CC5C358|nr:cytochrome c3 family protein [Geobacter sp. AOG2]GFE59858.1 cytochrome c [Geobacter sp. AOG2]